jgi:hypothetical protein
MLAQAAVASNAMITAGPVRDQGERMMKSEFLAGSAGPSH